MQLNNPKLIFVCCVFFFFFGGVVFSPTIDHHSYFFTPLHEKKKKKERKQKKKNLPSASLSVRPLFSATPQSSPRRHIPPHYHSLSSKISKNEPQQPRVNNRATWFSDLEVTMFYFSIFFFLFISFHFFLFFPSKFPEKHYFILCFEQGNKQGGWRKKRNK